MRYMTYYNTIMGGLSDVKVYDNKDDAVKFYHKEEHNERCRISTGHAGT